LDRIAYANQRYKANTSLKVDKMSRVSNSVKNIVTSYISEVIVTILKFVTRTVFIQCLNTSYLGINGLFTNILSMLSLAELGIGSALLFKLYKPIEENEHYKIVLLMKLYKQAYRIIGFAIGIIGLALIPLLPIIIKDYGTLADLHINAVLIYLLYLFQSISSYWFFAYKSALVNAHQKEYLLTIISYIFSIGTYIAQILVLIFLRDFIFYTLIFIIFRILQNLAFAIKSDKLYSYLNIKTTDRLPKEERRQIFKDCYAIFLYKINSVVINATDNIVLSSFIGLKIVGIYSNYLLLVAVIKTLFIKFYNAITPSLGSLHATGNTSHELKIFKVVNFITFWMFGIAAIGVAIVGDNFISTWLGNDFTVTSWRYGDIVYKTPVILLIAIEIYIFGLQQFLGRFRNAMGLFQQAKYRPVVGIIINLAISITCAPILGIAGVVLGTIISSLLTYMWYDPLIIYKHVFRESVLFYYFRNLVYVVVVVLSGLMSYAICTFIPKTGWLAIIAQAFICATTSCIYFTIAFWKSDEFKYVYSLAKKLFRR